MNGRLVALAIGAALTLSACGPAASRYPEIDADLRELRLFPLPVSAPAPPVSAEQAVQTVRDEHAEPIDVLRVGRRSNPESTFWVVIFRKSGDEAADCECAWTGLAVDDHTGDIAIHFDDLSWRAFDLPPPPWE
jgi:hypothetical protein